MKKYLFIICVLSLLLLVGCAEKANEESLMTPSQKTSTTQVDESMQETNINQDSSSTKTAEVEQTNKELTKSNEMPVFGSDLKQIVEDSLTGPVKVAIRPPSKDASYGENLLFGFGIYNSATKQRTFRVTSFEFIRAVDANNNVIEVDEKVINKWILTEFDDIIISSYKSEILPIYLNVGDIDDGQKPLSGVYEFKLIIYEAEDEFLRDKYGQHSFFC